MMRSLFSGVAGLKTHQTRMDVIGNNIANVNTVAYKSQSATFQELMYQNTQNASAANQETGRGGINAKQIGLGSSLAAINTNIALSGSSQTTGNAFDVQISGDAFFIVSDGSQNHFTRAGAFYVDGVGNLAMTSNGYNVMGWQPNETGDDVLVDTVSPLKIMSSENMVSSPEQTTKAYIDGVIDKNDTNVATESGRLVNISLYDALGYSYIAQLAINDVKEDKTTAEYWTDPLDTTKISFTEVAGWDKNTDDTKKIPVYIDKTTGKETAVKERKTADYYINDLDPSDLSLTPKSGFTKNTDATKVMDIYLDSEGNETLDTTSGIKSENKTAQYALEGQFTIKVNKLMSGNVDLLADKDKNIKMTLAGQDDTTGKLPITFNTATGAIVQPATNDNKEAPITLNIGGIDAFGEGISIDLANLKMYDNKGTSTVAGHYGDVKGNYAGRKKGALSGVAIQQDGKIFGSYDNGTTKLLGQIAVASFANPSGLEKIGDNLYDTTQNSGEFDGIGKDITADGGGSLKTGVLEMSNVDLSSEFTEMITTQRGFQANSRIITVSDTMLEELINLKR